MPNQSLFVFAEGLERVKVTEYTQLSPFMRATVESIPEIPVVKNSEIEALQRNVLTLFQQIVAGSPTLSDELSTVAGNIDDAGRIVDFMRLRCRRFQRATSRTCWRRPMCRFAWRRSTSTWRRSWKSSNCVTRFKAKCRTAYSKPSASIICASR